MTKSNKQKLIDNETVFREYNEKIQRGLQHEDNEGIRMGYESNNIVDDVALHFHCECSDENCKERILMKPTQYKIHHVNRSQFIVIPGHQVMKVERVVEEHDTYNIVENHDDPPVDPVEELQETDADQQKAG